MVGGVFRAFWWAVTLPIRLIAGLVGLLGRVFALGLGFALMVAGVALCAGPLYLIGIPVFVVGLVMTLRSLG